MQTASAPSTNNVVQDSPPSTVSPTPVFTCCRIPKCRESFINWPHDKPLDFDTMAAAGWCNIGDGHVKSCCCDIALDWEVAFDPWELHARLGPECAFLREQKGQGYIDSILAANPSNEEVDPGLEQSDIQMSPQDVAEIEEQYEEHARLRKQLYCYVCEDDSREVIYLPCGELACCRTCDPAQLICPICRGPIEGKIRTFLV